MGNEAISVVKTGDREPMEFRVLISSNSNSTSHIITLSSSQFCRLAGGSAKPEMLVEAALRFLLDRIPEERIAKRFDLPAIGQYFPDFELELPTHLATVDNAKYLARRTKEGAAEAAPSMDHSTVSPRA